MKTDCINYDNCRLPAQTCNDKCKQYKKASGRWQDELLDITNRAYYQKRKDGNDG